MRSSLTLAADPREEVWEQSEIRFCGRETVKKVSEKAIFWNTTAPHLHYVQKALLEGAQVCKDVAILLMTD